MMVVVVVVGGGEGSLSGGRSRGGGVDPPGLAAIGQMTRGAACSVALPGSCGGWPRSCWGAGLGANGVWWAAPCMQSMEGGPVAGCHDPSARLACALHAPSLQHAPCMRLACGSHERYTGPSAYVPLSKRATPPPKFRTHPLPPSHPVSAHLRGLAGGLQRPAAGSGKHVPAGSTPLIPVINTKIVSQSLRASAPSPPRTPPPENHTQPGIAVLYPIYLASTNPSHLRSAPRPGASIRPRPGIGYPASVLVRPATRTTGKRGGRTAR
jgi:hypothetical protein